MGINKCSVDNKAELCESYITRGFDAKAEGKLELAVRYFSCAFELTPPRDLEFMLSLDIFSMYRELGQYDLARNCLINYEKRNYRGLSSEETAEIKVNLKYLEILQDMLAKANTPNLPYSRVPVLIKVSVEEKINCWKNETL